mgnify:CR=1 FL=1
MRDAAGEVRCPKRADDEAQFFDLGLGERAHVLAADLDRPAGRVFGGGLERGDGGGVSHCDSSVSSLYSISR